jgi:predicted O-methyltransferase YrrM
MKNFLDIFDSVFKKTAQLENSWEKKKDYTFTTNWFDSERILNWQKVLKNYVGLKEVQYLEVGTWEGRSLFWMMDHVLTGPQSAATVIDPFFDQNWLTFNENLMKSGQQNRIQVYRDYSGLVLPRLKKSFYDIIYIDGAHDMKNVMIDSLHSWSLLKPEGVIIFDDYLWNENKYPQRLRPQMAIEAFVLMFKDELKILSHQYQLIIQKRAPVANQSLGLSCFGHFSYHWHTETLHQHEQVIKLKPSENLTLQKLIRNFEDNFDIKRQLHLQNEAIRFATALVKHRVRAIQS